MAEATNGLATRRSRRSTAGNRMEAALAELGLQETNKDLDDDIEFINERDEEDIFESDFASTDEEANQEDMDARERAVHEEEKSARKAARSRLEKRTAAVHLKHKATFNPQAVANPVVKLKLKPESATPDVPRRTGQKRKSQRRHTILNTSATDIRVRETEEKKASAPKKFKPTVRSFTQAELIQRALDNEEGNIKEHRNYLEVEEEKRKKARVIKMPVVEGPLLRWVSKVEEEKVKVQVEVTQPPQPQVSTVQTYGSYTAAQLNSYYAQLYHYLASQPGALSAITSYSTNQSASNQTSTSQLTTVSSPSPSIPNSPTPLTTGTTTSTSNAAFSTFRLPSTPNPYPFTYYTPPTANTTTSTPSSTTFQPAFFTPTATTATAAVPSQPPQKKYVEEERIENVAKNYVVVEADQREGIAKPLWKDMMKAMFGDHIRWEELKVLSGKGRPLGRVKQRCPITGEVAPYLDPRTGVPFADVQAYKVLTDLLEYHYVWSPEFGCYVCRG